MADLFYGFLGIFGFGHPMHPVIVHLVIGPIIAAFIFFIIGMIWKQSFLFKTAHILNILAFVFWFFTVGVGTLDWIYFYGGAATMPEIAVKFTLAGILFVVLIFGMWLYGKKKVKEGSLVLLATYFVAVLLCVGLGIAGGDIVYGAKKHDAVAGASSGGGLVEPATTPDGFKQVKPDGFDFQWKINGQNLDVRLSYATSGWVGVGFGTTGTMQGSSIFLGYIKKDGTVVVSDEYGNARDKHVPVSTLGSSDVATNKSGKFENGITTLVFTIPLVAKDKAHVTISPGDTVSLILAAAPPEAKDTVTYHGRGKYAVLKIKL